MTDMTSPSDDETPSRISQLVAEFMDELRGGRQPQLHEFCQRAGNEAEELRPLLATIVSLESARDRASPTAIGTPLSAPSMPTQLGDFRLLREAGRGGMGVVFEAIEIPLNRRVAVKVLDQRVVSDAVALQRFEREARAAATLHHTNIVPVFAIGSEHNVYFYVMPFIEGITLAELLSSLRARLKKAQTGLGQETDAVARQLTPGDIGNQNSARFSNADEAEFQVDRGLSISVHDRINFPDPDDSNYFHDIATIGLQVADALDHAAQQGILHRDIKPANLMLTADKTLWVMDFGLARFNEQNDLTATGEIMGTPRYLAPERLSGQHTIQGDLYGLGMVLYELLTLRTAFDATDRVELLQQIVSLEPVAPRIINPRIPRDLETIVQKCLEKDGSRRYRSPADLAQDLRLFLDDRPIASRRASRWELALRWCRRSPGIASLLASVVVLLVVIAVGALFWARSLRSERDIAREAGRKAVDSETAKSIAMRQLQKKEEEHRQALYRAYLEDIQSAFDSLQAGQRLKGLESARNLLHVLPFENQTPDQQRDLRNAVIACLSRADVEETVRVSVPPVPRHSMDIHPDFEIIAIPGENSETTLRWLNGTQPDVHLKSGEDRFLVSNRWFSPCGRWLYEILISPEGDQGNHRRVWEYSTKRLIVDAKSVDGAYTFCFDPVRRDLLHMEGPFIKRYNLETGHLVATSAPRFSKSALAISYDGKYLAVLTPFQSPSVLNADTFELIATLDDVQHRGHAEWLRSIPHLFVGAEAGLLELWKPLENLHWPLLQRHTRGVTGLCSSPDGRFLCSTDGGSISHVQDANRHSELIQVPGTALRFSRDSSRIAIRQDNQLVLYALSPSDSFIDEMQSIDTVRFSPDGCWLLTGGRQGVLVYATNPLAYKGSLGLDDCGPVAWHPSGDELATFGIFTHLARWPVREEPSTQGLILDPPKAVILNPVLARLGADDNIPQHWGRHSLWSPDGKTLYFADSRHGRVRMFDRATERAEVFAECHFASHLAISGDGKWLAVISLPSEVTRVWDTTSRECVLHLPETGAAAFTENGKWLATGSRDRHCLFETSNWQQRHEWPTDIVAQSAAYPLAFQPGTELLAAAVSGHTVRLFDVESKSIVADLTYQADSDIRSLAFSPEGTRLAVVRSDTLSLWDLARLRTELSSQGVPTLQFPPSSSLASNRSLHSINRGDDLPSGNMWWTGHELLAKFEALKGNFPDAIEAMNSAMLAVHRGDDESKWKVLTLRAQYHLAVQDLPAAHADLMDATRIRSSNIDVSRQLAELQLFGPPSIRDSAAADVLLRQVCESEKATIRDQLHRVLAMIQHRPTAARKALEEIAAADVATGTVADEILMRLLAAATKPVGPTETSPDTLTAPGDVPPDLNQADQARINVAHEILTTVTARPSSR